MGVGVAMMEIGVMGMAMGNRLMLVPMAVWFPRWRLRIMRVVMMKIMAMLVLMAKRHVAMAMFMCFAEVKV